MDSDYVMFPTILATMCIVSAVATSTVLLPLISSRYLHSKTFTLLAGFICFGEFLKSIVCAIRLLNLNDPFICQFQAAVALPCPVSAVFWIIRLTHFLYRLVVIRDRRNMSVSWLDHVICWGFPLIISFSPIWTGWVAFGHGGSWNKHMDAFHGVEMKSSLEVLNLICAWEPTAHTPHWMFGETNSGPYIGYALLLYFCILIILTELIIILYTASRIDPNGITQYVRKYFLYPMAFLLTQGAFNLCVILAINGVIPWKWAVYSYSLNFLSGLCYAACFWFIDDVARQWLRNIWYYMRGQLVYEGDDEDMKGDSDGSGRSISTIRFHTVHTGISSAEKISFSSSELKSEVSSAAEAPCVFWAIDDRNSWINNNCNNLPDAPKKPKR